MIEWLKNHVSWALKGAFMTDFERTIEFLESLGLKRDSRESAFDAKDFAISEKVEY